jgi:hypothetical protein
MKRAVISALLLLCVFSTAQTQSDHDEFTYNRRLLKSFQPPIPKDGYVPDKDTAIAIAYAIAVPVFGRKDMDEEKPFRAELNDGVWMVLGTLHCDHCAGGTLIVEIDKTSGKIITMTHTQ